MIELYLMYKIKVIFLNYFINLIGVIFECFEVKNIVDIFVNKYIFIISDEIYVENMFKE